MKVRKEKGFTLVEVIVVAVIVAVLAAVAIPLYMGYIKDSRINVGNNVGGTLCSAAGATKQQALAVPTGNYAATNQPVYVTFPSIANDAANPNLVLVPVGFTAVLSANSAYCYFTTYGANTAQTYQYAIN